LLLSTVTPLHAGAYPPRGTHTLAWIPLAAAAAAVVVVVYLIQRLGMDTND